MREKGLHHGRDPDYAHPRASVDRGMTLPMAGLLETLYK